MDILLVFAPVFVQMFLLSFVGSIVNRTAYRFFGKFLYLLLMWPGVVVHECSHVIGCILTRTKIHQVKFFSPQQEGNEMVLGYVAHDRPKSAIRRTIVAGAPFFGGAAVIFLLVHIFLPSTARIAFSFAGTPAGFIDVCLRALKEYGRFAFSIMSVINLSSWKSYVFLYLLFSISAHVAPSRTDLIHALEGVAFFGAMLLAAQWVIFHFAPAHTFILRVWSVQIASALTVFFGYGLVILLVVAVVLGIVATIFRHRQ